MRTTRLNMADISEITDTLMDVSDPAASTDPSSAAKKRRKRTPKNHTVSQFTIRDPPWAYIYLQHLTSAGPTPSLDAVTAQLHITAALSQFLGLHGTAIPVDIMKLEGGDVWIRVPAQDKTALVGAVGGWVSAKGEGWRVKGTSSWDSRAMARDSGQDLFVD